jgi:hypothetical protein
MGRCASIACSILTMLAIATSAAAQGSRADSLPSRACFRGRPEPRCQSFWVTEFSITPRLNANPSGQGGPNYYFTWDLGLMRNTSARTALGGAVFLGGEDDGSRLGLTFRYRRWITSTTAFDLSPGVLVAGGDNQRAPRFPGFTGTAGIMHRDLVGLAARFEVVPDSAGRVETAWYGGVRFGSYPGIVTSIVGPLLVLLAVNNSCVGLGC